jgi:phage gp45-like
MHISDSVNPKLNFPSRWFLLKRIFFFLYSGTVQEGASQMGQPLILTKNRNNSPDNSNSTPVEEPTITTTTTQTEISEQVEEDNAVNGKLDINIKDNSIHKKSENNTNQYRQLNEFKHNYH